MEKSLLSDKDRCPTPSQICAYIDSPLWEELNAFLQRGYQVEPKYTYSNCSEQPGWNVKYQKSGRALCTLYPMQGHFFALVVIGNKEKTQAELLLPLLSEPVQKIYAGSYSMSGAKWLMIPVIDAAALSDVKQLIELRRKITI